jgi:hypothetical protein
MPVEKLGAQSGLKGFKLLADGGLGQSDFLRGGGGTERARRRFKGPEPCKWREGFFHPKVTY